MKITIKRAKALDKFGTAPETEGEVLEFDTPVPVKTVLQKLMIPDDVPALVLVNGMVKKQDHVLRDGDTLSIFPKMAGG